MPMEEAKMMKKNNFFVLVLFTLASMAAGNSFHTTDMVRTINGVSVPSDFPDIEVNQYGETAPGKIFFSSTFSMLGNYIVILENDGTPYFYRKYYKNPGFFVGGTCDFKLLPTGVLSVYIAYSEQHLILDPHYTEIDSFSGPEGYSGDNHEFLLLPNRNAMFISNKALTMDLTELGGKSKATVFCSFIQEMNTNHSLVWQWDPFKPGRYQITDAIHEDLKQPYIDAPVINSIALDYDGQLIVSARYQDEVTKINHETGDIIWRLGGANNQFEWIGETIPFTCQHHARPVPDRPDHYTIYDNGNYRTPNDTRAVEYKLDLEKMTAEKVWEFWIPYTNIKNRHMMGSVQRLSNGNTYIDWSEWPPLQACEVDSNGRIVFEMTVNGTSSYRSKRFEWEGTALVPYLIAESYHTGVVLIFNKFGDPHVDHYKIYGGTHPNPTSLLATSRETYVVLTDLQNYTDWYFRVKSVSSSGTVSKFSNEEHVYTSLGESGESMVLNGDFSDGTGQWDLVGSPSTGEIDEQGQYHLHVEDGGPYRESVRLSQKNLKLVQGITYVYEFDAYSNTNRLINGIVHGRSDYGQIGYQGLKTRTQHFSYEFLMTDPTDLAVNIIFNCGGQSDSDIYFDNISLKEVIVSAVEQAASEPFKFELCQNIPNPFNGSTKIRFNLSQSGMVVLKIYNLLGEEIQTLVNHRLPQGEHEFLFESDRLPSGIYLVQLKVGDISENAFRPGSSQVGKGWVQTKKMIIQN
jgi:hypothetical protein